MKFARESQAITCPAIADAARPSLAASAGLFLTSTIGYLVNQLAPEALCAKALAVVGGFYFFIGSIDLARLQKWKSQNRVTKSDYRTYWNII